MTPDFEIEHVVSISEFEEGWESPLAVCSTGTREGHGLLDVFDVSHHYVPPAAKYVGSESYVRVSTARTHRSVATEVSDEVATMEFTAEVITTDGEKYHSCHLLDSETGSKHGTLSIEPKYVPEGCTDKGATYSTVVQIEYDHERMKEVRGYPEEKIARLRESAQDFIDDLQGPPPWEE